MAIRDQTIGAFLHALGDKTPTPGGGAVAGVGAAIGGTLAQMVVRFAIGKPKFAAHAETHERSLRELQHAVDEALTSAEEDERAYAQLNRLWKLPTDHADRAAHWDRAVAAAIEAPRRMLRAAAGVLEQVEALTGATSATLASDLAIAADFAAAAARSAAWNIRINLPLMSDPAQAAEIERSLQATLGVVEARRRSIEAACAGALKPVG
jgi:methenyltetrahydrofolate cyclohydrolase